MRIVEMYQCEFCNETYFNKKEALECEALLDEEQLLQVGDEVVYEIRVGGGFSPIDVECTVSRVENKGHYYEYTLQLIENDEVVDEFLLSGNSSYFDRIKS